MDEIGVLNDTFLCPISHPACCPSSAGGGAFEVAHNRKIDGVSKAEVLFEPGP